MKLVRLFCALPIGVLLSPMGWLAPYPLVLMRDAAIPLRIKYCAMDSARFVESNKLLAALPVLSVCPSIRMVAVGLLSK